MKKLSFYLIMVAISATLTVTCAEVLLRLTGVGSPWTASASKDEPIMLASDAALGWVAKPGKFTIRPYTPEGSESIYTVLDDGSRATSDTGNTAPYDVIFLGGSFTQGFAVSDRNTFAWKLQSKFPSLRIGNFGVCGYGTYQSLLLLKDLYRRGIKPAVILYGFLPFHEERNIAHSEWLRALSRSSKRGHIETPFCSLDAKGELMEHEPRGYPVLPFREHIFSISYLSRAYYGYMDQDEKRRRAAGFEVTKKLMLAMNSLAKEKGAAFLVAVLADPGQYESFFATSGIETVDCRLELDSNHVVPGDGHPNEKAHSFWAETMAAALKASRKDIFRE